MVQEIMLFSGLVIAVGYLYFRLRPTPGKDTCAGECGCSVKVKSEVRQKS